MIICIKAKKIFRSGRFILGEIWIQNGIVIPPQPSYDKIFHFNEHFITPGFIDCQVNGGFDIDLTSEPEKVEILARKLCKIGVTAFLPTIISTGFSNYSKILPYLAPRIIKKGAEILGAHLEGPYINPLFAGAHDRIHCITFKEKIPLINVKMMTIAPELPGALPFILELKKQGIVVAAGHTGASFDLLKKAKIEVVTHLYNAMGSFHHRSPGVIDYALTQPNVYYTLIGDGKHLSKQALSIAYRCHPEGMILVSDSSAHLHSIKSHFKLGGQHFSKGALAGSATSLTQMVKMFPEKLEHAIFSVTKRPARLLKLQNKGELEFGFDADMNVFDESFNLTQVMLKGSFLDNLSRDL